MPKPLSKAELRALIPPYDEALVKKIPEAERKNLGDYVDQYESVHVLWARLVDNCGGCQEITVEYDEDF